MLYGIPQHSSTAVAAVRVLSNCYVLYGILQHSNTGDVLLLHYICIIAILSVFLYISGIPVYIYTTSDTLEQQRTHNFASGIGIPTRAASR